MRLRNYLVTHKKRDPRTDAVQNKNITNPLHYITVNYFTANSISTKSERMRFWTLQRKLILNPRRFWAIQRELLSNQRQFWAIKGNFASFKAQYRSFEQASTARHKDVPIISLNRKGECFAPMERWEEQTNRTGRKKGRQKRIGEEYIQDQISGFVTLLCSICCNVYIFAVYVVMYNLYYSTFKCF